MRWPRPVVRGLQYVGEEKLNIANNFWKAYHFRLTGGPTPVDLWFDESHRLLRHEFVEEGARVVVHMVGVRR